MKPPPHNRILIVDDCPSVLSVFEKMLTDGSGERGPSAVGVQGVFQVETAQQGPEALEKVEQGVRDGLPFSLAFVDVLLPPGPDGFETVARMWEVDPTLQIVICTACVDYSWERITARLGVSENFVILRKPFELVEVLQLAHALTRKWLATRDLRTRLETLDHSMSVRASELEASNARLRLSEERFAMAFRASPVPLAIQTLVGQRFVDVNDAFLGLTGFSRSELIGHTPLDLRLCIDYEARIRSLVMDGKPIRDVAAQISTRGGELLETLISIERMTLADEVHTLMMVQDISARLHLENQLRQAQKMEAVGQLAAGVAHDFNNMLTIIQGHASLQLALAGLSTDTIESLQQITLAADRAANLTRQLLAFSRRQIMCPRVLRLNDLLRELTSMLRRLIGENIELYCELAENLPAVWADSTGLEQVLMNLTLNARDAMPRGGRITIKTEAVAVTATEAGRDTSKRSGDYVALSVQDSGTGMDASTRARIFEPFFTTKEVNKGTGMGLATVYGIVSQHEGWIDVETAPHRGSIFRVFLPATDQVAEETFDEPFCDQFASSQRTILIVEDEDAVRSMVKDVLEHHGYRVLEAAHAAAALAVAREHRDELELLLTDVVMPGELDGLALARVLHKEMPTLKIIYTSGYSAELFASDDLLEEGVNYLPKPYVATKLLSIVRNAFEPGEAQALPAV